MERDMGLLARSLASQGHEESKLKPKTAAIFMSFKQKLRR